MNYSYTTTYMNLKGIMLSKRSHSQKVTYSIILLYDILEMTNYKDKEQISGCQELGIGKSLTTK